MATSEVSKFSVYDPRVIQTKPKYAVEKGALSLTNVTFNAQTANSTAQQFNVIVPSENVFIDRAVEWTSSGVVSLSVTIPAAGAGNRAIAGQPLMVPGRDVALAAFPSHQTVAQMTATINDATVTVNTQDVLNQVLRLSDLAKHRRQRTCPTMLDNYAVYPDTEVVTNSPINAYNVKQHSDEIPNGAWSQWWFCDSQGTPLNQTSAVEAVANYGTGTAYDAAYGIPLTPRSATAALATDTAVTFQLFLRWQSTELLLLPPFIFGDAYELSTGLFGVQNFQVQMNLSSSPARAVRISSAYGRQRVRTGTTQNGGGTEANAVRLAIAAQPAWATGVSGSYPPFAIQPALSVQFLTPSLDVPLPPKSIVPYMEFPRYITTGVSAVASTLGKTTTSAKGVSSSGGAVITSNTITLPNIPDLLMIYAKPATPGATLSANALYPGGPAPAVWDSSIADFTLPIQAISINFDNFSGLLANHTQYQLYKMTVNNGIDMDFPTWAGESKIYSSQFGFPDDAAYYVTASAATTNIAMVDGNGTRGAGQSVYVSTVGGPLVLRPGRDFALQAGQAPGLVGNFTLQVQLTVGNQFAETLSSGAVNLYIVPISSGFFETIKGSSRIIKGVLTEQDILGSPAHAPDAALVRNVGAGMAHGRGGRAAHKMSDYEC